MWKDEALELLPEVGEVRWEVPDYVAYKTKEISAPRRCVVISVNREKLCYTVRFDNGFRETYKVPRLRAVSGGGSYG